MCTNGSRLPINQRSTPTFYLQKLRRSSTVNLSTLKEFHATNFEASPCSRAAYSFFSASDTIRSREDEKGSDTRLWLAGEHCYYESMKLRLMLKEAFTVHTKASKW